MIAYQNTVRYTIMYDSVQKMDTIKYYHTLLVLLSLPGGAVVEVAVPDVEVLAEGNFAE